MVELLWNISLLLGTGMLTVYHGMKWKETGNPRNAFYTGLLIMCTIINIKPLL